MEKDINIRAALVNLQIDTSIPLPLERYDYIMSCKTRVQMATGQHYVSRIDKENSAVIVTRVDKKPGGNGAAGN